MTSKLIPKDPSSVTVIRNVTPNIITSSAPFARFGRLRIGGRGTLVRLTNGSIAVFSPTALVPEVQTAVQGLGNNVQYIVALDIEHHIFLTEWAKAFPEAKVLGPDGLPEKREGTSATAGLKFSTVWTEQNKVDVKVDAAFDADFDYEFVGAHGNKELVFLYKPEKTLIQADLIFNLPATEQYSRSTEKATDGFLTKLFTGLQGTQGNAAKWQKRFIWYAAGSKNRPSFGHSVTRIAKWDFDRMIPCHGDVIETGANAVFRNLMQWHLDLVK